MDNVTTENQPFKGLSKLECLHLQKGRNDVKDIPSKFIFCTSARINEQLMAKETMLLLLTHMKFDYCVQGCGEDLWAPGLNEAWAPGKRNCESTLKAHPSRGSGSMLPRANQDCKNRSGSYLRL